MITIYPRGTTDFSTNGAGILLPLECRIKERANGMYRLEMAHPISDDLRWSQIQPGCIVKASAPVRESPLYELDAISEEATATTVVRKIYKVDTTTGQRLQLRQKPSMDAKVLGRYAEGTEVVHLGTSGSWAKVSIRKGGAVGYMYAQYLKFHKDVYETVTATKPVTRNAVTVSPAREQLFRIRSVEVDTQSGVVTAQAVHAFYDLRGNIVNAAYTPDNADANTAARKVFDSALIPHDFTLHPYLSGKVSGEYSYLSIPECLLEPDTGILSQAGGYLVRDNYDVFLLPPLVRDMGVTIRRGKNLAGVVVSTDATDTVTRIVPVGKDKNGNDLFLSGGGYVDVTDVYPDVQPAVVQAKRIDYDVRVGTGEGEFSTAANARAELERLAKAEFANGIHLPAYGMKVDFVGVDGPMVTKEYAALQAVHLFDTVTVIDEVVGVNAKILVTGYVWDVLAERYESVTLGVLMEDTATTYGYTLAEGSISGGKIANGAVTGSKMRDATIGYAKIATAAIEQLVANSVTAVRAHIGELVAGNITTDQLYADLATLAAAQITAAKIAEANIDWASITTLRAEIATIAKAQITAANIEAANIQWAEIDSLAAKIAEIAQAKIDSAEIDAAKITGLEAEVARLVNASIKSADIGFAQIKDLVAGSAIITQGVGGELYIARLAVTEANMVSLSVGELIVKGADGRFYALGVDASGKVTTTVKQVNNDDVADLSINAGEKIIEGTVTAACLNAQDIFANNAIIKQLMAANIDVAELFAREATIAQLNAADISGNKYIKLAVDGVKIGGTNLLKGTQDDTWEAYTSGLHYVRPYTELAALGVAAGDVLTYSLRLKVDKPTQLRMIMTKSTSDDRVVDVRGAWFIPGEGRAWVSAEVPAEAGYVRMYIASDGGAAVDGYWKGEKLEKGNKATDWSPAPEDPARALSTGTTVLIDDERFNVRTKVASFDIIDDASGEDEELVRIDSEGLTAKDGTFETVHSDSVVSTQAAATFRPANAGEMQAILDSLSNRFLLGEVTIVATAVTGGEFSLYGVYGNGTVSIRGGVLNGLTVTHCSALIRVFDATFNTSGTAVSAMTSRVYLGGCAINAARGVFVDRNVEAVLYNCTGSCTTLADVTFASALWIAGSTVPYGVLGTVTGEVYSPLAFTAAPSAPSVETVQTATLNATTTRTWNGGWLSGDALYQGKTGSDGSLRRGCMWFDLSAISGKTIIGATLTLKRYDGIGGGGSVAVGIYGTTAASASGTPAVGTKYASVSMANGATKSVDVPAAVRALASGSIKGLMIYDTQTGTYSGKSYTYGYCKLYGSGQSAKPVLKVTYK